MIRAPHWGLGIDTLSPDRSEDGFPVHQLILGAGKFIIENVANASQMPPIGAYSLALPMKIQEGTGGSVAIGGDAPNTLSRPS